MAACSQKSVRRLIRQFETKLSPNGQLAQLVNSLPAALCLRGALHLMCDT